MELKIDFVSLIILVERSGFVDKFTFGNRLYELRTQNNLTQKQLAMYLGVSNKAVSKWETGEAMPRVKTLQAIAQCFGITYSDLLSETPSEEKLPPYEIYYRNKIEAKEADFVNQSKFILHYMFFLYFVKALFYLFNIIFLKVNIVYSVVSTVFIVLFCFFYSKFKSRIVKNVQYIDIKELNSMFCFLSIPFLHSIIDAFAFYKYDLIGDNTLLLHVFPLVFVLVLFFMLKKACSNTFFLTVGFAGGLCSFINLLFWRVNSTDALENYFNCLPPPLEISDPSQPFFVGLITSFILLFNHITFAVYVFQILDFYYLSQILIEKMSRDKKKSQSKKRHKILLLTLSMIGVMAVIGLFLMLFKTLNIFEHSKNFFN